MRLVALFVLLWSVPAVADGWTDVPALIRSATAPVDGELRKCSKRLPNRIAMIATRTRAGTAVAMPMPGVGGRGFTPEERCLMAAIAKVALPALPAEIERVILVHAITDAPATPDKAFDDWRDPAATLATLIDAKRRAALAACDGKPRTVRVILDLRAGATRVWLPAWQFHSASGDGSTPPAQRRVKACLTKAIRDWHPPALPSAMAELELALAVGP